MCLLAIEDNTLSWVMCMPAKHIIMSYVFANNEGQLVTKIKINVRCLPSGKCMVTYSGKINVRRKHGITHYYERNVVSTPTILIIILNTLPCKNVAAFTVALIVFGANVNVTDEYPCAYTIGLRQYPVTWQAVDKLPVWPGISSNHEVRAKTNAYSSTKSFNAFW